MAHLSMIDVCIDRVQRTEHCGQIWYPPEWQVEPGQHLTRAKRKWLRANGWQWCPSRKRWWKY